MPTCPFCELETGRKVLAENARARAIYDKHPVSPGHVLILPRTHEAHYFALDTETQRACWALAQRMYGFLQQTYQPDGFNVGINCGVAAGQTVMHAHIHLIPRYTGDVEQPRGGVRGTIPGRADYGAENG